MTLNREQQDAITSTEDTLVVAGAGSGKTTVLAMRVLYALVYRRVPLSRILVLTFTIKATKEMYQRIYDALDKVCREKRFLDYEFLHDDELCRFVEGERDNFAAAQISTIDSFVLKLARTIAPRLGYLFPLSVSDEDEDEQRIRYIYHFLHTTDSPVLSQVMTSISVSDLIHAIFNPLLKDFSVPMRDFLHMKTHVFDMLKQHAHTTKQRVDTYLNQLNEQCHVIFGFSVQEAVERVIQIDDAHRAQAKDMPMPMHQASIEQLVDMYALTNKTARLLAHIYDTYIGYDKNPHWWRTHTGALHFDKRGLATTKIFKKQEGAWQEFKECMEHLQQEFSTLLDLQYTLDNEALYESFYVLCQKCVQGWVVQKKRSGKLSFYELSRMVNHGLSMFTDISEGLVSLYQELVVDEFQDINDVQKELFFIVKRVAKVAGAQLLLFFVGDPKQAIYSFRGADIERYLALSKQFDVVKELRTNYRSLPTVIQSNNAIFSSVFADSEINGDAQKIQYREQQAYEDYHLSQEKNSSHAVQCDILTYERGEDKQSIEVLHCARRILALHHKEGIDFDRMAVLGRTNTMLFVVQRIFRNLGIPFYLEEETLHLKQDPVSDFYSWLCLLVYPTHTLAYAEVLRSALSTMGDDALMQALAYYCHSMERYPTKRESSTPLSLDAYAQQLLFTFGDDEYEKYCATELGISLSHLYAERKNDVQRMAELRMRYQEARRILEQEGLYECLQHFWYGCGYLYAIAYHASPQQASVFEEHYHSISACIYHSKHVYQCIHLIHSLLQGAAPPSSLATTFSQTKKGVQVMTAHKAKGLEFDFVFLLELGRNLRARSPEKRVFEMNDILAIDLGITGMCTKNRSPITSYNKTQKDSYVSEELRIVYVGMTRAKQGTILLSTIDARNVTDKDDRYQKYIAHKNSPLSWILAHEDAIVNDSLSQGIMAKKQQDLVSSQTNIAYTLHKGADVMAYAQEYHSQSMTTHHMADVDKKHVHASIVSLADSFTTAPISLGPLWLSPSALANKVPNKISSEINSNIPKKISSEVSNGKTNETVSAEAVQGNQSSTDKVQPAFIAFSDTALEAILGNHGLYSDFGSYCHYQLSALCTHGTRGSVPLFIASKVVHLSEGERALFFDEAHRLCDGFMQSSFWKKCKKHTVSQSLNIKADYEYLHYIQFEQPVQTKSLAQNNNSHVAGVYLKGFIDLLVSTGDEVYIIDFKTDSHIVPQKYFAQLVAYKVAIESLKEYQGKTIYCVLYYLRNGEVQYVPNMVDIKPYLLEILTDT